MMTSNSSPQLLVGRYKFIQQIGKGGFGAVEEYFDLLTDEKVAIKTIPSRFVNQESKRLVREVDIMFFLCDQHPHIISYYNMFVTRSKSATSGLPGDVDGEQILLPPEKTPPELNVLGPLYGKLTKTQRLLRHHEVLKTLCASLRRMDEFNLHIVMPLMKGDLFFFIKLLTSEHARARLGVTRAYLAEVAAVYAFQICYGLDFLHKAMIIHRDMKPDNILVQLSSTSAFSSFATIADLGLARDMTDSDTFYVCTRYYRPPEIITSTSKGNASVDVWSLGCILYEMCTGHTLFTMKSALNEQGAWDGGKASQQLEVILNVVGTPSPADLEQYMPQGNAKLYLQRSVNRPSKLTSLINSHWILDCDEEEKQLWIDLISRCLNFFWQLRPTAEELCRHRLFVDRNVLYGTNVESCNPREYRPTFPEGHDATLRAQNKAAVLQLVVASLNRRINFTDEPPPGTRRLVPPPSQQPAPLGPPVNTVMSAVPPTIQVPMPNAVMPQGMGANVRPQPQPLRPLSNQGRMDSSMNNGNISSMLPSSRMRIPVDDEDDEVEDEDEDEDDATSQLEARYEPAYSVLGGQRLARPASVAPDAFEDEMGDYGNMNIDLEDDSDDDGANHNEERPTRSPVGYMQSMRRVLHVSSDPHQDQPNSGDEESGPLLVESSPMVTPSGVRGVAPSQLRRRTSRGDEEEDDDEANMYRQASVFRVNRSVVRNRSAVGGSMMLSRRYAATEHPPGGSLGGSGEPEPTQLNRNETYGLSGILSSAAAPRPLTGTFYTKTARINNGNNNNNANENANASGGGGGGGEEEDYYPYDVGFDLVNPDDDDEDETPQTIPPPLSLGQAPPQLVSADDLAQAVAKQNGATPTLASDPNFPALSDPRLVQKYGSLRGTDAALQDALKSVLEELDGSTHDPVLSRQLRELLNFFASRQSSASANRI